MTVSQCNSEIGRKSVVLHRYATISKLLSHAATVIYITLILLTFLFVFNHGQRSIDNFSRRELEAKGSEAKEYLNMFISFYIYVAQIVLKFDDDIECNKRFLDKFLGFYAKMNRGIRAEMKELIIYQGDSSLCSFDFKEETVQVIDLGTSSYDISDFDYYNGTLLKYTPFDDVLNNTDDLYWLGLGKNKNRYVGVSFDIKFILDRFNDKFLNDSKCNFFYALLNNNDETIFTTDIGLIKKNSSLYLKNLSSLNSEFWEHMKMESKDMKNGEFKKINYKDSPYQISKSFGVNDIFTIINVVSNFPIDKNVPLLFILCVSVPIILNIVITIVRNLLKVTLLNNQNNDSNFFLKYSNENVNNFGLIEQSINQLRKLRTKYIDDVRFNEIIDLAIENLTNINDIPFEDLDDNLNNLNTQVDNEKNLFPVFKQLTKPKICIDLKGDFDFSLFSQNPSMMLFKLYMTIIFKDNLFFKEFDPDLFMKFLFIFLTNCIRNPLMISFCIHSLYKLIHNSCHFTIIDKIDIFTLYLVTLSQFLDFDHIDIEFKNNFVQSENIRKYDNNVLSQYNKNNFFFSMFYKIMNIPKEFQEKEFYKNFENLYYVISISQSSEYYFETIGMLRIRIHSMSFFHDNNDKQLFLSFILKLTNLCGYWAVKGFCKEYFDFQNMIFFKKDEINDISFQINFQIEFINNIVIPTYYLYVMTNYGIEPGFLENIQSILNYWESLSKKL